jgi:Ca-activated chloride channel family protein
MYVSLRRLAAALRKPTGRLRVPLAALLLLGASLAGWTGPTLADAAAPPAALASVPPDVPIDAPAERSLSPYFAVDGGDPAVDALPLKSTKVNVRILGVLADVTVTQQYRNAGKRPLEARYVFPASTRAAVHGLQMRIGDRLVAARIREREQARQEYDAGRKAGRTAGLLEQHRDNVFQMSVANILPGDVIDVELRYTELIVPSEGRYQFVFPTVVGPRYNGAPGTESHQPERWIAAPFLRAGRPPPSAFELQVELATPVAVQEATSPSHVLSLVRASDGTTVVRLARGEPANDRDFVLDYRLAGDAIRSGLLLSRGADENFFLAMVEPPARVPAGLIVPRDYVFVVDVSGSMHGFPLDTARTLMDDLLSGLRPSDTFNLVLFAGDSFVLAPRSVAATRPNVAAALDVLSRRSGGGGTELVPALRRALALPIEPDRARSIVVVTDGYVGVERETFDLVRRNLSNASLFAFGIGSSVNRMLIEGLARAGQGEPFVVLDAGAAPEAAERFRRMIDSPVLTDVTASFEGLDTYDVAPVVLPDLYARRPIVLYGKWRGEPRGALRVRGRTAAGPFEARVPVDAGAASERNAALRYLWARTRIAELTDQEGIEGGDDRRDAILALGLEYGLLTQYTSFVAVDRVVRRGPADLLDEVDQPSPLPKGVSDLAVGATVPATPEPETAALLAVLGVIGGAWLRRRAARRMPS